MAALPPSRAKINTFIEKPADFDGSDFTAFRRQINLYLTVNKDAILGDEERIIFVLSFMKTGLASQWAENFYEKSMADTVKGFGKFDAFMKALQETFEDPNKGRNAQHKLATTRQGQNETAEAFFQRFELNRRAAGYTTGHDDYLIQVLETNLKRDIVKTIYTQELPVNYDNWKKRAIQIDQQERRWKAMFPAQQERRSFYQKPQAQPPRQEAPSGNRTFPGMGEPMDLDRKRALGLCFNCGQKGHLSRDCSVPRKPRQQQQVRQVATENEPAPVTELTQEEKNQKAEELRAQLRALGF